MPLNGPPFGTATYFVIEKSYGHLKSSLKSLCATKRYLVLRGSESSIQHPATIYPSRFTINGAL